MNNEGLIGGRTGGKGCGKGDIRQRRACVVCGGDRVGNVPCEDMAVCAAPSIVGAESGNDLWAEETQSRAGVWSEKEGNESL